MKKDFAAERQRLRGLCLHATELIDELQKMHPAATPDLDAPERKLWADIGARKVIEFLIQLREEARGQTGPMGSVLGGSHALR